MDNGQGLPTHMRDGRPLQLAGKSDARWRERIGNMVPPPAAKAIAEVDLKAKIHNDQKGGSIVMNPKLIFLFAISSLPVLALMLFLLRVISSS